MSSNYAEKLKHPVFKVVSQYATEHGLDAYVIGGFVRDLVMERPSKDIDILVLGDGPEFAEAVAKILRVKKVSVFKNFGTAHFRYKDLDVEFVGARKESYSRDSRKPITEKGTLQDDQNRRDFTINTLALKLNTEAFGELVDPFGGVLDIEKESSVLHWNPKSPSVTIPCVC